MMDSRGSYFLTNTGIFQVTTMLETRLWLNRFRRLSTVTPALAPLTLGAALLVAWVPPASAIPLVIQSGNYIQRVQQPSIGSFIYGSPIPTPMPVNPLTGEIISGFNNYYPYYYGIRTPQRVPVSGTIYNSTLVNPTLVNPNIYNSVIINPTIVPSSVYPSPYIGRRGIIYHPGQLQIQLGY